MPIALANLTPADFDLNALSLCVTVPARFSKNRGAHHRAVAVRRGRRIRAVSRTEGRNESAQSTLQANRKPLENKQPGAVLYWVASDSFKLPGQDSNLDQENQNLLCYRYTTG